MAVFDFDGTLTQRDTLRPFMERCAGKHAVIAAAARHPVLMLGGLAGGRIRDRAKAALVRDLLRGRRDLDLRMIASDLADHVVRNELRADTVAWLRWHQHQGHRVFVISASFDAYVRRVAEHLGATAVIATDWETGPDGRLTGQLRGGNVRGQAKVDLLRAALGNEQPVVYAYGDSSGDAHLLAIADVAHYVRRRVLEAPAGPMPPPVPA